MDFEEKLSKKEYLLFFSLIIFLIGIVFIVFANIFNLKFNANSENQKNVFDNNLYIENDQNIILNDPEKEIKMLFFGDVMMDRSIRRRAETVGYDFYFKCVSDRFSNYDFVTINLEGPITNYVSNNLGQLPIGDIASFQFTMSKEALSAMKRSGINVFGVANNHIFDYGRSGVLQTRENILNENLFYFGDPIEENYRVLVLEKNNIKIALIPFNEFFGSATETISDILKFRDGVDKIIVFAHWGDEYVPPPERVKKWAREFVDNGADVIIGHHPHIVQDLDFYKNKPIFYSLGNFIFDQYWEDSVRNGGVAEIVIKNSGEVFANLFNLQLNEERIPCFK
ncbi:MAG TPA: CapA family protein [Candidatus Paceibacterota bacterium]|nr:CapA family protein [Candidatus Paceibacterota bacterium]